MESDRRPTGEQLIARVQTVAASVVNLTPTDLEQIERAIPALDAADERWAPALMATLDSERTRDT